MKNGVVYIISVVCVVAFSSFCMYDTEKMRGARGALGIILLSALAIPFVNTLIGFSDISFDDIPIYGDEYSDDVRDETLKKAFLQGIEQALKEEFFINEEDMEVTCSGFSLEYMKAEKINITLSGSAAFSDLRAIREFVEESKLGECEVFISCE